MLERMQLIDLRHNHAEELSGGQQKLLEMARMLMPDPPIVMLDEPFAGVHPVLCKFMIDRIEETSRRRQGGAADQPRPDLDLPAVDPRHRAQPGPHHRRRRRRRHPRQSRRHRSLSGDADDGRRRCLELVDVDVAYHGDIRILRGLSLKVRPGMITGVIGPNGAGKSTALKALYGLLKPVAGDVLIDGRKVTGLPPWKFIDNGIALVPQQRSLFNELSVEDNLRLACWSFRRDRARVEEALERAYAQFPMLRDKRRDLAGSMSGGQQRFLELGRALALQPRVLLLDEPTAMIAPRISAEIYEFIHGLPAQGITVLLVDQNVRQCVRISDHLYVLELGQNKVDGSAARLPAGRRPARPDRRMGGLPHRRVTAPPAVLGFGR